MNVKRLLGFAAVGGLLIVAAPAEHAQALSLINPGAAAAVQDVSRDAGVTEVRWYRRHYRRHYWRRRW